MEQAQSPKLVELPSVPQHSLDRLSTLYCTRAANPSYGGCTESRRCHCPSETAVNALVRDAAKSYLSLRPIGPKGIEDRNAEMDEIALVTSSHREAVNTRRRGDHGVFGQGIRAAVNQTRIFATAR